MDLKSLTIHDQKILRSFLSLEQHALSAYSFENIYIWKALFDIEWLIIEDSLCIFFKDKMGRFLYLSPLAKNYKPTVLEKVFRIMDAVNPHKQISRIENVEEKHTAFYRQLGYEIKDKFPEYLCCRSGLTQLKGEKFKSKRACYNYFIKHYDFEYLKFSLKYRQDCLGLYDLWVKYRQDKFQDPVYRGMLLDSRCCLKILLDNYGDLDFAGRIVTVDKEVRAFTFGFHLNKDTFCILYEITDLAIKGLSQFIFREFCSELKDYRYINVMDDSGLDNLKKVKMSYQPLKLIPSYIVRRKNA